MKILGSLLIIGSTVFAVSSQQTHKYEFQDECGNPEVESQLYFDRRGKVLKIIDGDTVQIRDRHGKKWVVQLAGADSASNDAEAKRILTERILNKEVVFFGNPDKTKGRLIEAIVRLGELEINRYLVENGISAYRGTDYGYAVSKYTLCVYTQLEERAKAGKLGIWASK